MKIILVSLISLLSLSAFAQSLNLKPALWSIKVYSFKNGQRVDMLEAMNKQLALLPKEQREAMVKAMGTSAVSEQCITKGMLASPDKFSENRNYQDCKMVPGKFNASSYSSTLKCADGKEVYTEISAKGDKSFISKSVIKSDGESQKAEVVGTFSGEKCR